MVLNDGRKASRWCILDIPNMLLFDTEIRGKIHAEVTPPGINSPRPWSAFRGRPVLGGSPQYIQTTAFAIHQVALRCCGKQKSVALQ